MKEVEGGGRKGRNLFFLTPGLGEDSERRRLESAGRINLGEVVVVAEEVEKGRGEEVTGEVRG